MKIPLRHFAETRQALCCLKSIFAGAIGSTHVFIGKQQNVARRLQGHLDSIRRLGLEEIVVLVTRAE